MERILWKAGLGAGVLLALPIALLAPAVPSEQKKAPFFGQNIAHRGLFTADQRIPENSLAAFRRAVEAGYGVELDVQLSRDGQVVVFHDDDLKRVCGVDAPVDALDYAELQVLPLCGTGERMPLFSEVLQLVDGRTPMIVELKNGRRNRELCEKTLALLRAYSGPYCIESFNPTIVAWFRFHAPDLLRGQLAMPPQHYGKSERERRRGVVLGNTLLNFLARPEFIAYEIGPKPLPVKLAEAMGAMKVGWTSHDRASEQGRDTVIFEHYEPPVKYK